MIIRLVAMGFYFYFDEGVLILRLMDFFFDFFFLVNGLCSGSWLGLWWWIGG